MAPEPRGGKPSRRVKTRSRGANLRRGEAGTRVGGGRRHRRRCSSDDEEDAAILRVLILFQRFQHGPPAPNRPPQGEPWLETSRFQFDLQPQDWLH